YSTLPALAFTIYRSSFMKDAKIPITDLNLYNELRSGYTGGHVDVYKPFNTKGHRPYVYDVNSLYPAVMKDLLFPVGIPEEFEGSNIDIANFEGLGFLLVEVDSPLDLKIPLLQTRINGRTVAPV